MDISVVKDPQNCTKGDGNGTKTSVHQLITTKLLQQQPQRPRQRRRKIAMLAAVEEPAVTFPIHMVRINWDRLINSRRQLRKTIPSMPTYLFKPEILKLLDAEKHHTNRLILDLMWSTGARISEALALTPASFVDDGYNFGVNLKTLRHLPGRPSKASLQRSVQRYVPIVDALLQDRIQSHLYTEHLALMLCMAYL